MDDESTDSSGYVLIGSFGSQNIQSFVGSAPGVSGSTFYMIMVYSASGEFKSSANEARNAYGVVAIPWGDREAYYIADKSVVNLSAHTLNAVSGYLTYNANDGTPEVYERTPSVFCTLNPSQAIGWTISSSPLKPRGNTAVVFSNASSLYSAGEGETVFLRVDSGLCDTSIAGTQPPQGQSTSSSVGASETISYRFKFRGSGGVSFEFSPDSPESWFNWENSSAVLAAYRDAFDGARYAVSTEMLGIGGPDLKVSGLDYPFSEAGNMLNLIGRP
jgi:hypothetical protein